LVSKAKAVKSRKVADADLDAGIRRVLDEMRAAFEPDGWTVHVERTGKENLCFEFRNPLSPIATGMVFKSDLTPAELRQRLDEHVKDEPEFAHLKRFDPPRRKRQLLSGVRWAATWYGWSDRVFEEVLDSLLGFRVLSKEEWTWLMKVGPTVLSERVKGEFIRRRPSMRRRAKAERLLQMQPVAVRARRR
jgi:hypothetical protein